MKNNGVIVWGHAHVEHVTHREHVVYIDFIQGKIHQWESKECWVRRNQRSHQVKLKDFEKLLLKYWDLCRHLNRQNIDCRLVMMPPTWRLCFLNATIRPSGAGLLLHLASTYTEFPTNCNVNCTEWRTAGSSRFNNFWEVGWIKKNHAGE